MADERQSEVLGALPRSRPHRRSAKRPERAGATATPKPGQRTPAKSTRGGAASPTRTPSKPRAVPGSRATAPGSKARPRAKAKTDALRQPPQPRGIPSQPRSPVPSSPNRPELLGTVVQAAAELTEIGLSLGAQVLRRAVARLPRP